MRTRPDPRDPVVRLKSAVRRVADFLPPPRDEALIGIAREAWALFTGKRGRGRSRRAGAARPIQQSRVDPMAFYRARRAFDHGAYDDALARVEFLLAAHPDSLKALNLKKDIHNRRGDISDIVATYGRMLQVQDDAAIEYQPRGHAVGSAAGVLGRCAGIFRHSPLPHDGRHGAEGRRHQETRHRGGAGMTPRPPCQPPGGAAWMWQQCWLPSIRWPQLCWQPGY